MPIADPPDSGMTPATALAEAYAALRECRECALHEGRTQVVYGVGDPSAALMFVGEGPGFNEDKQGEPFVGQAGRLLTELLASIGLRREDVYIANVVKCRPPGNRDPLPEEIAACSPLLMRQIELVRPRVVCTLGRFATRLIAQTEAGMGSVRGRAKPMTLGDVPVIVFPVLHPAAALYTPANRTLLEEDFRKLRRLLDRGEEALANGPKSSASAEPAAAQEAATAGLPDPLAADESGPEQTAEQAAEQLPLW